MKKIYQMRNLTDDDTIINKYDFFLFAANSDQRCYRVISKLKSIGCPIGNTIVFDYEKLRPKKSSSEDQSSNKKYNEFEIYHPNVILNCSNDDDDVKFLYNSDINDISTIGLDITGFTIPDVFRILYVLKEFKKIKLLHVFYTEPKHYLFKDIFFDTYEYLIGERTYQAIPEYYITNDTDMEILVCFLGFDKSVSNILYEKAIPNETVVVNGFPSYLPKLKEISLLNNYSLLTTDIDKGAQFFAKANNPFSSYNTLCDIRKKYPKGVMNICVLGTKPMALGACMFALDNLSNVKVTYLYPQNYSSNTTEESNNSWHFFIEFD